ncbi:hypothetical protein AMK59_1817 [Oryctes borbonicus]|uniref:DUF4817 domain-containing protein n=1 Tax=Oryctes borbonicus TaxID=1629725 RepID=A0A0T6BET8_9SCAR|nr:hypothetical protein AMK59_1817 [Oryctes borbonicus]
MSFTPSELCDMILIYGEMGKNVEEAQREYKERFPNRQCPTNDIIMNTLTALREKGTLPSDHEDSDGETEPTQDSNGTILHNSLFPHYVQAVELTENDYNARIRFCIWLQEKLSKEPDFSTTVLFTGECCFTNRGILNYHNPYTGTISNSTRNSFQYDFSVNVWAGIIDKTLLGPFIFPSELNGESYLQFLQSMMPEFIEDIPLQVRKQMWFMHDGAPLHISQAVRTFFHMNYNEWIGRGGHVQWPVHSPDLNPLHYFLWTYIKNDLYHSGKGEIDSEDDLKQRILRAAAEIQQKPAWFKCMHESLPRRAEACLRTKGDRFHYFL